MPGWSSSNRRDRLPADWLQRRRRILKRDGYMCQWRLPDGTLCLDSATDVDHITPGDDHRDSNLQGLCPRHHAIKSSREGAEAGWARKQAIKQRFKVTEQHPGMIGGS